MNEISIRLYRRLAWGLLLAAFAGPMASADTVTLTPVRDNTLYEDGAGALSNGAGAFLFSGRTNTNLGQPFIRRAVLSFDVAAAVPAGATINSADLTLTMSRTISSAQDVELRRLLADWGEGTSNAGGNEGSGVTSSVGDATWIHRFFPTDFWTVVGSDFTAAVSAVENVGGLGSYTWASTAQMVTDVQGWLDDPASNFGWVLIGNEADQATTKRFNSRENVDGETRPQLVIDFTAVAAGIFSDGFESGDTTAWSQTVNPAESQP